MKNASAIRRLLYSAATLALLVLCFGTVAPAQTPKPVAAGASSDGNNSGGVGRGDNGQIVRVTVKLANKLLPGIRVQVKVGDGSLVTSGLTSKTGTYIVPLDAGDYIISVTNSKGNATSPITVVKATDPALITLTLAPPAK